MSTFKLRKYPGGFYSVTSIINYVFGTPDDLVKWSVKAAAEAILRNINQSPKMPSRKRLLEAGEDERLRILHEAGKKGTAVHNAIQNKMENKRHKLDDEYKGYFEAFLDFISENPITPIVQEQVVCSDKFRFAGRFDMYGELWGERVLIDYKTSNHLRSEYGLQLAAYAYCLEQLGYPVTSKYVLHLRADGTWGLVKYEDSFEDFLAVREVFERKAMIEEPEFEMASDFKALQKEKAPDEEELSPTRLKEILNERKVQSTI